MSKRRLSSIEDFDEVKVVKKDGKKHTLDSDEEDSGAEEERLNVLNADDIEGEEEGVGGIHDEITITPFNMKEELEEGHFDQQGHYHWKKEKEIKDSWLDNIDWVKVKGRPEDKYKIHKNDDEMKGLGDDSSSDEEPQEKVDILKNYKEIFSHMKPKETIAKTLQRLGANSKISSAERWKRKKAGIVDEGAAKVTRITELANQILTETGNMDVYQETYEKLESLIKRKDSKDGGAPLDMYADDFDLKEKSSLNQSTDQPSTSQDFDEIKEVKWEFKWSQEDEADISGPHTTQQMHKWSQDGYFKTGVFVRKVGEQSQFYTSNRIDFELYI